MALKPNMCLMFFIHRVFQKNHTMTKPLKKNTRCQCESNIMKMCSFLKLKII